MEKAIIDAVTAAVNDFVPAAVNNAIPAWINATFSALITQAVEEKCKEKLEQGKSKLEHMEKSMETQIARNKKAARLEAKVTAANDMILECYCSISSMVGPQVKDWLERKNEQELDKIRRLNSELFQIYKEENEEKAREKKEKTAEQT